MLAFQYNHKTYFVELSRTKMFDKLFPINYHTIDFQKITKDVFTMTISAKEIVNLPLDSIRPNPYQPRRIFEQNGLDELARSIKSYGVLQPISVRLMPDGVYELVSGERRLRASKLAGVQTIPAIPVTNPVITAKASVGKIIKFAKNPSRGNW